MNIIAFFNNKGGVGKTSLVYHLAWMYAEQGRRVLAADLDPQSNLTAMFLPPERLEEIWPDDESRHSSILQCVRPFLKGTGDVAEPYTEEISDRLALLPGDLALSRFEDRLSQDWPKSMDGDEAAFRVLSAFYRVLCMASRAQHSDVVLVDVGPNLGAINRAAMIASDWVVTPLAPDLFSIQGLRNLGPTLQTWRSQWKARLERRPEDQSLELPRGRMEPAGYVVMQAGMRLDRPVKAYQRWVLRVPEEYCSSVLGQAGTCAPTTSDPDPQCLGVMRHYQSLMPLAQDAQKPMFNLRPADGAIGAHMDAVQRCRDDFKALADRIALRCGFAADVGIGT